MTRVSGIRIIKTPCCGALLSTSNYLSMNFMAWEYWTDGHDDGSLMPDKEGLRRCVCGSCFLMRRTTHVAVIPQGKPPAPLGWEQRKDNWWTRFWERETREQIMERYDVRTPTEIEKEKHSLPPYAERVSASKLKGLIDSGIVDKEIEVIVRRLYWQHLNEPFREVYRKFREENNELDPDGNSATFPVYFPSDEQVENMQKLVTLLESTDPMRCLERAELYRELGDFDKSKVGLTKYSGERDRLHFVVDKLITLGVTCPVRFDY